MNRKLVVFLFWIVFAIGAVNGNENQRATTTEMPSAIDNGRGIGGTGMPSLIEDGRGIGGTGMPAVIYEDRGIGGSGIIGTITEFGSIWVNGIEIELNNATQILLNDQPIAENELRLGQQVAVLAHISGGIWYADQVIVNHVLTGKVEQITKDGLVINGFTLKPDMKMPGQWPSVNIGEQLNISGYFENSTVYVTDVMITENTKEEWQVTGPATLDAFGNWSVGGSISIPDDEKTRLNLEPGDSVTVNRTNSFFTYTKNDLPFRERTDNYLIEYRSSDGESDIRWSDQNQPDSKEEAEIKKRAPHAKAPTSDVREGSVLSISTQSISTDSNSLKGNNSPEGFSSSDSSSNGTSGSSGSERNSRSDSKSSSRNERSSRNESRSSSGSSGNEGRR